MSDVFRVQIYDKTWLPVVSGDGTLIREIANTGRIDIERQPNESDKIKVQIPRGDASIDDLRIGRILRVLDMNGNLETSGIITGPLDKEQYPFVEVNALGKAEILSWAETPWRFQLKSTDPSVQMQELLVRYKYFRQNTQDDFTLGTLENTELLAIAASTTPSADTYHVVLATTSITGAGSLVFATAGTFTSQWVDMSTPVELNRLRYEVAVSNNTDISVQVRFSASEAGLPSPPTFTSWTVARKKGTDTDREELGITDLSSDAAYSTPFSFVQSRFLFSTTDTFLTPALRAFELVGEYPFEISKGSITIANPNQRREYTFDRKTHLHAIGQLAADNFAEFEVTSGFTLHIRDSLGTNVSPTVAFNIEEDANIIRYEEDDETLQTSVYAFGGFSDGLSEMVSLAESTTNQKLYGIRAGRFNAVGTTLATVQSQATDKLNQTKEPLLQISAEYVNMPPPTFRFGDSIRLRIASRSISTVTRALYTRKGEDERGEIAIVDFGNVTQTMTGDIADTINVDDKGLSGSSGTSGEAGSSGSGGTAGTSGADGTSGTSGNDGADGTSGTSGTSADYAEMIESRQSFGRYPEPGDVVIVSPDQDWCVELTNRRSDSRVAGIVSTAPGMLLNQGAELEHGVPLALVGVVPCKAVVKRKPIKLGDLLVTSDLVGHVELYDKKSRQDATIVGKAVTTLHEGVGMIKVLMNTAV